MFASQRDRDTWLKSQIEALHADDRTRQDQVALIGTDLTNAEEELNRVRDSHAQARAQVDGRRKKLADLEKKETAVRAERFTYEEERKYGCIR